MAVFHLPLIFIIPCWTLIKIFSSLFFFFSFFFFLRFQISNFKFHFFLLYWSPSSPALTSPLYPYLTFLCYHNKLYYKLIEISVYISGSMYSRVFFLWIPSFRRSQHLKTILKFPNFQIRFFCVLCSSLSCLCNK